MTLNLKGRHLTSIRDLSGEELLALLERAIEMKREFKEDKGRPVLAGKTLGMIFQKPSLRTRVSFEAGMTQLGGHAIYLAPTDISIGQRETTEDIAIVLSRMVDVLMARTFGHEIVTDLAKYATVPVINGLSDFEHPCQVLADLMTVLEKKGRLAGLTLTYVGDGNNVCHSLLYGCALVGMHIRVATPAGYEPSGAVAADATQIAARTGARVEVLRDPHEAARDADVIYTDVWASMGQEAEAEKRRKVFPPYQVNAALLARARADCMILHCLPAHYGDEIDYDASRLPNSAIFEEAENRLHVQKALLVSLLGA
jgi:ornithine carbamoyltransferase